MASATTVPARVFATFALMAAIVAISQLSLYSIFISTFTGPGSYSRIFAIVLLLANLKNAPYMWHVRVYGAILKHFLLTQREFDPAANGPAALFQPVITSSRSPVTECDYNLHKSNSTYFSDLDVSRSHLVCALLRRGIQTLQKNQETKTVIDAQSGKPVRGSWYIMLGSAHCSFKREIKPYEAYEMWSRVLCWDRKWIYVVTHFVQKGRVRPDGYTLDTGRIFGSRPVRPRQADVVVSPVLGAGGGDDDDDDYATAEPREASKHIFASALSKYVVKLGRLTIHPEVVFAASGLLPSRPGGWAAMDGATATTTTAPDDLAASATGAAEWDWRAIERENKRGLKYAQHFAAMDGLHETFTGSERGALGVYRDLFPLPI